jgi:predicted kinase
MRGASGSGKSTIAQKLARAFKLAHAGAMVAIVSADTIGCLVEGFDLVIVDNTNARAIEVAPFMAVANAYDFSAKVLLVPCDVETAVARTVHGVPREAIEGHIRRLEAESLPPWWVQETYSDE